MAPTKNTTTSQAILPATRKGLTRRANNNHQNAENMQTRAKRKAENSPIKNEKIKRSALGNLTNNVKVMTLHPDEDAKQQHAQQHSKKPTAKQLQALLDAKQMIIGSNTAVVHPIPRVTVPVQPIQPQQPPPPLPFVQHVIQVHPPQIQPPAQVEAQRPQQQQQPQQQPKKMTTRATRKTSQEVMENCHRVLDRFEEMLGSRQKRKPARKPAPPPCAPIAVPLVPVPKTNTIKPVRRISNEFNKTEESLYMSALEDVSSSESIRLSGNFEAVRRRSAQIQLEKQKTDDDKTKKLETSLMQLQVPNENYTESVPEGVEDFDKLNWNDPFQVSYYAMDIFNYMKAREKEFPIIDYMPKQVHLSKWMRTLLVDWMVEVQETFELNHETLYLAVKIVDIYLCREVIHKEKLQLLGAAALFIACKFDERQPPLIEDFLYICDGAYKQEELVRMEMETLRTVDYDLGIPLSYRFLRRYARCAKVQMPTLTLARYILELSLMDYATVSFSDSQMAAAALFMALRMHSKEKTAAVWSPTLDYYTGYTLAEFADLVPLLNAGLHRKPKGTIKTIRNKYSHKIFHEVAKVPLLSTEDLFKVDMDLNNSNAN